MAIQTSPNSKPGSLFFTDARTCKEWLKSIPLTNIPQAQQNILDAIHTSGVMVPDVEDWLRINVIR